MARPNNVLKAEAEARRTNRMIERIANTPYCIGTRYLPRAAPVSVSSQ